MAKTAKLGEHKYFTMYTSQDMTPFLNQITGIKGANGYLVYNELYRLILGGEYGYYVDANQQTLLEINRRCNGAGLTIKDIDNIVKELLAIGALSKEQYEKNKIYTNKEIQMMHIEAGSRRLENYIFSKHFLLKKDDILSIKKEKLLVKKDKKCIFIDKKLVKDTKNIEMEPSKSEKNTINVNNYNENDNILENNVNNYNENVDNSSREIKLNYTKLNNTKQNEIKKESKLSESKSDSNSKSKSATAEPVEYDFSLNFFTSSLLNRSLIPTDYVTVRKINDTANSIASRINDNQLFHDAGYNVIRTMIFKKDPIYDYNSFIRIGLEDAIATLIAANEEYEDEED